MEESAKSIIFLAGMTPYKVKVLLSWGKVQKDVGWATSDTSPIFYW